MFTTYIISTENRQLYAGNNFYMAVEYFKWACANNFNHVEFREHESAGKYKAVKIFNR